MMPLSSTATGQGKIIKHSKGRDIIKDIKRSPFKGLGKPEPLKYQLKGYWSRRIDEKKQISV